MVCLQSAACLRSSSSERMYSLVVGSNGTNDSGRLLCPRLKLEALTVSFLPTLHAQNLLSLNIQLRETRECLVIAPYTERGRRTFPVSSPLDRASGVKWRVNVKPSRCIGLL